MTILVTGAGGQLGRLVIDRLLARGADPATLVAGARTSSKVADLAERGIRIAVLDYEDPATIAAALDGVDRVLLISGNEVGRRFIQHRAVIDAAVSAGVSLFAYTSLAKADASSLPLAAEHVATEQAIAASGLPAVILRNNWYAENYLPDLSRAAESGVLAASAGDGRVSGAARADYAEAAAVVLLGEGHAGNVYELSGDTAWSYDDIAAAIGEVAGRPVLYHALTTEEHAGALEAAGLDEGMTGFVTALDAGIARGDLESTDTTLSRLIGRPTTPLADALRAG